MKIVSIETAAGRGKLIFCRIKTDSGLTGFGESFYIPSAVAAIIHDWMAYHLIGEDPLDIDRHWRYLYERATNFGARGAELRALSAVDLALWDIKGKALGVPIWQLIGGKSQDAVAIYNSSGGPSYAAKGGTGLAASLWPGYGAIGEKGPLNDYWSAINEPVDYAKSLIDEGIMAVKMWTLDFAAHKPNGPIRVRYKDIEEGLRPFFKIREHFGNDIELILDGHGFFQAPMAERIARVIEDVQPLWLEDVIRPDCIQTVADFRARARVPIAASEMFSGPDDFRSLLQSSGCDYVMIDPTWIGGISQTLKTCDLARFYNVPVVMHDCTGPLTLLAGVQVAIARGNVAWQETLRAHIRMNYPTLVDEFPPVSGGHISAPPRPGLGADLLDELFEDATYRKSEL